VGFYWLDGFEELQLKQGLQPSRKKKPGALCTTMNGGFRLQRNWGKGFDRTNLQHMRSFFMSFPIRDAVRRELSWTH
jgi:hypothetical protein